MSSLKINRDLYNGIYESGSNANGSYVKFADGTLECIGYGSCPANEGYANITFPYPFINTNYIMLANHKYTGGGTHGSSSQLRNITNPQNDTTSTAFVYSYMPDGTIASYVRNVQYIAKGKWK